MKRPEGLELGTLVYELMWSGLNVAAAQQYDAWTLEFISDHVLSTVREEKFLSGLEKLGLSNQPPAVRAGRYHYFSNLLGGVATQVIEESPQKVWVRYPGQQSTWPGLALLACPVGVRWRSFTSWHPHNGRLMGSNRLGWVITKMRVEGDPYDEGYFIEHDHDLTDDELVAYESPTSTPAFDPAVAPKLDEQQWPEARRRKARWKYPRTYARETIDAMTKVLGRRDTTQLLNRVLEVIAIQYTDRLYARACEQVSDTHIDPATYVEQVLWSLGAEVKLDDHGTLNAEGLDTILGQPAVDGGVWDHFVQLSTRMLNGGTRVSPGSRPSGTGALSWSFHDEQRWIW